MIKAIIGCSPSSGSSLLRQIINRNKQVFCSPETYLFSHRSLYTDWESNKSCIKKSRLPFKRKFNDNYLFLDRVINYSNKELQISNRHVDEVLRKTNTLESFANSIFQPALNFYDKQFVIEKSPANAVCSDLFLDMFGDSFFIHIIRNPLDTIASIYRRTKNIYYAVAVNLLHTAHVYKHGQYDRFVELKYEDLINNPMKTMDSLMKKIGLQFEESQLNEGNDFMDERDKLPTWTFAETDRIRKSSVSSFERLEDSEKEMVHWALRAIEYKNAPSTIKKVGDIMEAYDYTLPEMTKSSSFAKQVENDYRKYMKSRQLLNMTISSHELPLINLSL